MKGIVYRYLSGFAFGVMMLVLCFLLTYTFGGQVYYEKELVQILKPNAFLVQTVWAGILYVCITITLINTHEFLKVDDNDVTIQYLLLFIIHIIVIIFVSFLAQQYGDFGLGVYSLLFGLGMIVLMFGTLADMIQNLLKMIKLKKKLFVIKNEKSSVQKKSTSRTASVKSTNSKSTNSKLMDSKLMDSKSIDSKLIDSKLTDLKSTRTKNTSNSKSTRTKSASSSKTTRTKSANSSKTTKK